MENMVKHILEIDKQVQELTVNTDSYRAKNEKEISDEIVKINAEYEEKLNNEIAKIEKEENENAEKKLYEKKKQADKALRAMRERADDNRRKWAQKIFDMVIGE